MLMLWKWGELKWKLISLSEEGIKNYGFEMNRSDEVSVVAWNVDESFLCLVEFSML